MGIHYMVRRVLLSPESNLIQRITAYIYPSITITRPLVRVWTFHVCVCWIAVLSPIDYPNYTDRHPVSCRADGADLQEIAQIVVR